MIITDNQEIILVIQEELATMKWLMIEKSWNEGQNESFRVPLMLLQCASNFLPTICCRALTNELIDFEEIVQAGNQGNDFRKNVFVIEKGIAKQIQFSVK